jgi:hypothetical protein
MRNMGYLCFIHGNHQIGRIRELEYIVKKKKGYNLRND